MLCEADLRSEGFLGGIPVLLGDDQLWAFPGPRELSPGGTTTQSELIGLLAAIDQSENEFERRQMELALAIYLLKLNYKLAPSDYRRILSSAGRDEARQRLQQAFRDLAQRHRQALETCREVETPQPREGRRYRFPIFRPRKPGTAPAAVPTRAVS